MMYQPLVWSEAFAVGHNGLDADHRRLVEFINAVEAINALCAAAQAEQRPEQLKAVLNAFKRTAVDHFAHEDSVLRKINDGVRHAQSDRRLKRAPGLEPMSDAALDEHIAEHTLALAKLELIIRTSQAGPDSARSTLCGELKDWFLEHGIKRDAHLKAIFQAMRGRAA